MNEFGLSEKMSRKFVRTIGANTHTTAQLMVLFEMAKFFSYCEENKVLNENTLRGQINAVWNVSTVLTDGECVSLLRGLERPEDCAESVPHSHDRGVLAKVF